MKKCFGLLMVLIFPFLFVGCGGNDNQQQENWQNQIAVLEEQIDDLQERYNALLVQDNINIENLQDLQQQLDLLQQKYNELYGKYYDWQKFIGNNGYNFNTQDDFYLSVYDFINTGRVKVLSGKYIKIPLKLKDVEGANISHYGNEVFSNFSIETVFDFSKTTTPNEKFITTNITVNDCDTSKLNEKYNENDKFYLVGEIETVSYTFSSSTNPNDNKINIRIINGTITEE